VNPLVQGLFNKFRETEDLLKLSDADAFELFATSLILPDDLLAQARKQTSSSMEERLEST